MKKTWTGGVSILDAICNFLSRLICNCTPFFRVGWFCILLSWFLFKESFELSWQLRIVSCRKFLCFMLQIYILYNYTYILYINRLYEWYILCMHGFMYGLVRGALPTKTQIFPFFLWWFAPSLRRVVSGNVGPRSHEKRRSLDAWLELGIAHYSGDKDGWYP